MEENRIVTVSADGEAEVDCDVAHFNLSISAKNEVPTNLKPILNERAQQLERSIAEILEKNEAKIVKNSYKTSLKVNTDYRYNRTEDRDMINGYIGSFNIDFAISNLNKINKIYNELSLLHNIKLSEPWFSLNNPEEVNKLALKDAYLKVFKRFSDQCELLGCYPSYFQIHTWKAEYDKFNYKKPHGKDAHINLHVENSEDTTYPDYLFKDDKLVVGTIKHKVYLEVSFKPTY